VSFETLEEITPADLQGLVGTAPERKRREYKRDLPGGGSEHRKEFVADITSFANSDGGDIFFGIEEDPKTHLPSAVSGVPSVDAENQITVLENVLRDSVRPRLPHVQMERVILDETVCVFVIRVGRSHLAPHQNMLNLRFFGRNTNGKYPLEVSELTDAITRRESLPDRIRRFRRERVDLIRYTPDEMPVPVDTESKLVTHFVPEDTLGRYDVIDVGQLSDPAFRNKISAVPVWETSGVSYRPNIDGFVYMHGRPDTALPWYAQVFYDGCVEVVSGTAFDKKGTPEPIFHPGWVERDLFRAFAFVREVYDALNTPGRISILATALGVRDRTISLDGVPSFQKLKLALTGHLPTVGRDAAYFNALSVESMKDDEKKALRPLVTQLWRASGLESAGSYNKEGDYVGYQH
jgi:Putative DNA-binding domain